MKKKKIFLLRGHALPDDLEVYNEEFVDTLYDAIISTVDESLEYKSIFDYAAPNYFRFLVNVLPYGEQVFQQLIIDNYLTIERFCLEILGVDVTAYSENDFWRVVAKLYLLDRNESGLKSALLLYKDSGRLKTTILNTDSKKYKLDDIKSANYYNYTFASINNGLPEEKTASITLNEEQTRILNYLDQEKINVIKEEKSTKSIFKISSNRFFAQIFDNPNINISLGDIDQAENLVTDFIIVRQRYFIFPETGEIGVTSGLFLNDNFNARVFDDEGNFIREYLPKKAEAVGYVPVNQLSPSYIPRGQDHAPLLPIPEGAIAIGNDYPNFAYNNGQLITLQRFFEINNFKPKKIININYQTRTVSVYNPNFEPIIENVDFFSTLFLSAIPFAQYYIATYQFGMPTSFGFNRNNGRKESAMLLVEFDTFTEMYEFQKIYHENRNNELSNINQILEGVRNTYYWREDW